MVEHQLKWVDDLVFLRFVAGSSLVGYSLVHSGCLYQHMLRGFKNVIAATPPSR